MYNHNNVEIRDNGTIVIYEYGVANTTGFRRHVVLHPVGNVVTLSLELTASCGCKLMETLQNDVVSEKLHTLIARLHTLIASNVNGILLSIPVYDCFFELFKQYIEKLNTKEVVLEKVKDTSVLGGISQLTDNDEVEQNIGFTLRTTTVIREKSNWGEMRVDVDDQFFLVSPLLGTTKTYPITVDPQLIDKDASFSITTAGDIILELKCTPPKVDAPITLTIPARTYRDDLIRHIYHQACFNPEGTINIDLNGALFSKSKTSHKFDITCSAIEYSVSYPYTGTLVLSSVSDTLVKSISLITINLNLEKEDGTTFQRNKAIATSETQKDIVEKRVNALNSLFETVYRDLSLSVGVGIPATFFPWLLLEYQRLSHQMSVINRSEFGVLVLNYTQTNIYQELQELSAHTSYIVKLMRNNVPNIENIVSHSYRNELDQYIFTPIPRF